LKESIVSQLGLGHLLISSLSDLTTLLLLTIILIPSAISDYREEKIPNILSMSGWVLGPLLHFVISGVDGLLHSGLGFLLLFVLTFPLWLIKWFGAADVKLIASVGAVVGGIQSLMVLLGIVVTGFVMATGVLILRGHFFASLRRYYHWFLSPFTGTVPDRQEPDINNEKKSFPYAIPIAFGTLLTILYSYM
jgi:prepilin peptidase CpaA